MVTGSVSIELCVETSEGVRLARDSGADRAEIGRDLHTGGLTPSLEVVLEALRYAPKGGLRVLVREDPTSFELTDEQVRAQTRYIERLGAAITAAGPEVGFVVGALKNGRVNTAAARDWRRAAGHRYLVFHRAFDEVSDQSAALLELIDLGYDAVLTTGGSKGTADPVGLAHLREVADGRITIIGSGGIRRHNAADVVARGKLTDVHFRVPDGEVPLDEVRAVVGIIRALFAHPSGAPYA